jgi:hypothetical protein
MSKWRETTLGAVCELKRGYDLPTSVRTTRQHPNRFVIGSYRLSRCSEGAGTRRGNWSIWNPR